MEALAAPGGLPRAALHSQLAAAVQVVLHMRRLRSGARVLEGVGVLAIDTGSVVVEPVWSRRSGWTEHRAALDTLLAEREVAAPW